MPRKYDKPTQFQVTPLDHEIMSRSRYDIDLWAKGYFDGQVFPYQRYFYHAPQKDKLLIAGIRTGKSFLASLGFMHYAQFNPYSRLLNTSISSEQAKIVYQNCLRFCARPSFQHWIEHVQSSPYPTIRFVNGSELWFRSVGYDAEHIRGFEFDVINIDEAAYITRKSIIDTLKGRLIGVNPYTGKPLPGIMWMISSPKGKGWLSDRWKLGDSQYRVADVRKYLSLRATIWDNPLLSRDQIEETMMGYSDEMIRQEFFGEFVDFNESLFPYHLVMDGCDETHREVRWLYDQIRFWNAQHESSDYKSIRATAGITEDISHYECEPQPGHRYVSSWDLGKKPMANGRNATVGIVFDITHEPWSMVAYLYREGMGYVEAKAEIERWHAKYSSNGGLCSTVIDATGKGDVLNEFIERDRTIGDLEGIVYSSSQKPLLLDSGRIALERGLVRYPFIRRMTDQLTNYDRFDKDLPQDIVMAYCQAMWKAREYTRISTSTKYQQAVIASHDVHRRSAQATTRNPRYVEGRYARRGARKGQNQTVVASSIRRKSRIA